MPPFILRLLVIIAVSVVIQSSASLYSQGLPWYWIAGVILLVQTLGVGIWHCIVYPKRLSPLRLLPHPPGGSFLMGHFWTLIQDPANELIRSWVNTVPNDGIIMYHDFFNSERLLVVKPKALADVMVTRSHEYIKPIHIKKGLGEVFGTGLVFAEGERHKVQRKELMPAFAFRHIKDLYPIFWEKATKLVAALEVHNKDFSEHGMPPVAHVSEWVSRATLDNIGRAGLGQEFRALEDPNNELSKIYRKVCSPSKWAILAGLIGFSPFTRFLGSLLMKFTDDFAAASALVKQHCSSLVQVKKEQLSQTDKPPSVDILSVALRSGQISDDDLVNHLMTFLLAGHETVSSALSWAIYFLCKHPPLQARLRRDILARLPRIRDPSWTAVAADIDGIAFLQAFCNETLRLRPPVSMTPRTAVVDTSIAGHAIPKGTVVVLCPWAVNSSQELWGADAAEFNPDRWMGPGNATTGGAESTYAFMTFLKGPRSCIGEGFARAEFACLLAAWVGMLETEFAQEAYVEKIEVGITLKPAKLTVRVRAVSE